MEVENALKCSKNNISNYGTQQNKSITKVFSLFLISVRDQTKMFKWRSFFSSNEANPLATQTGQIRQLVVRIKKEGTAVCVRLGQIRWLSCQVGQMIPDSSKHLQVNVKPPTSYLARNQQKWYQSLYVFKCSTQWHSSALPVIKREDSLMRRCQLNIKHNLPT